MKSKRERAKEHEMNYLINEMGQTIRDALDSWPRTARLCVLIAVAVTAAAIWTRYHY